MRQQLGLVALVVGDDDEAIAFYTQKLGFTLIDGGGVPRSLWQPLGSGAASSEDPVSYFVDPIGVVRSPFTDTSQIPKGQGAEHHAEGVLEIAPALEAGLADIEGFSHLYVLWLFDRVQDVELTARPPSDDRPHGVFATRSPQRPNHIGLTVVTLLGRDGGRLRVAGVDMLDGTPILDIKPYLSSVPPERLRRGWLAEAEARRARERTA